MQVTSAHVHSVTMTATSSKHISSHSLLSYTTLIHITGLMTDSSPNVHSTQQQQHPFNGPLSGTTRVSRYEKGKTNLDFIEARDSEWQWRQLGHMQICTSPQTDNHASTRPLSFFSGRMSFLPPKQQRQSTEGHSTYT